LTQVGASGRVPTWRTSHGIWSILRIASVPKPRVGTTSCTCGGRTAFGAHGVATEKPGRYEGFGWNALGVITRPR
jgi:hypothetical protein